MKDARSKSFLRHPTKENKNLIDDCIQANGLKIKIQFRNSDFTLHKQSKKWADWFNAIIKKKYN